MSDGPRAYTAEEARDMVLDHVRMLAGYWAGLLDKTALECTEGLAFSIMVMLDGGSGEMPAMTLTLDPHPDDRAFMESQGDNWFEPGTDITALGQLHEALVRK